MEQVCPRLRSANVAKRFRKKHWKHTKSLSSASAENGRRCSFHPQSPVSATMTKMFLESAHTSSSSCKNRPVVTVAVNPHSVLLCIFVSGCIVELNVNRFTRACNIHSQCLETTNRDDVLIVFWCEDCEVSNGLLGTVWSRFSLDRVCHSLLSLPPHKKISELTRSGFDRSRFSLCSMCFGEDGGIS